MVKRNTFCKKSVIRALIFALLYLICALLCFLSFPRRTLARSEEYTAVWSDGSVTRESYASAYSALSGAGNGSVLLEREGVCGEIAAGEAFAAFRTVLEEGSLPELLAADPEGLAPIERAALYRTFGNTVFYSADYFAFDGTRVLRTARRTFGELVLLDGDLPAAALRNTGAKKLVLRADARLAAASLAGSAVEECVASPPYRSSGGAVYLDTAGGTRLVAALPLITSLCADGYRFCDQGALAPCTQLCSLQLPFAGSAESASDGRLAWAFGDELPASLKRVKLTGGTVSAFTFAGCGAVEEIDLCGIPAEDIAPAAFARCTSLVRLHTSAEWETDFSRTRLPCGCYLYERSTR